MKIRIVEGRVIALSPIQHIGDEKTGSTPVLRTINLWTEDAGEVPMPYVSGNAIRGKTRRLLMRDLLERVSYELTSTKLHHALFSGGVLESVVEQESGVLDLAFRKRIRETLPPVALYGCALGNQLIQGIMTVEHFWPICAEYRPYLPERFQGLAQAQHPVRMYTGNAFITRRDDLRVERDHEEQAVQMKVDYECFVPGTQFYHRWVLLLPDAVQEACLGRVLELWALMPYIGGRSASGEGKLAFAYDDVPSSALYLEWVDAHKDAIRAVLADLEARL